jgi:DNA-binding XRE family transcriptional regulator
MRDVFVIPAQIRAARALLGWSQEDLARESELGITTVHDTESGRRGADTDAAAEIRRALWNGGVVFSSGGPDEGPGVRLAAHRPNMIRRPTGIGLPFAVEWQGKVVTTFVETDVIDFLGEHPGNTKDEIFLKTFDRFRSQLLAAITSAIQESHNFDRYGRLYIRLKDIDAVMSAKWYQITFEKSEELREKTLISDFGKLFLLSGIPSDVQVFRDEKADPKKYYFSPPAHEAARRLLESFGARACTAKPEISSARKVKL